MKLKLALLSPVDQKYLLVTWVQEEAVDPTVFPELVEYKTGFYSKGKVIRNESFKLVPVSQNIIIFSEKSKNLQKK